MHRETEVGQNELILSQKMNEGRRPYFPCSSCSGNFEACPMASTNGVFGLVDLLGWRNIRRLRIGLDMKPFPRTTVNADYRDISLASRYDGLYGSTGSIIVKAPQGGALSDHVGREADVSFKHQLRTNITIGAGYGHLFAGDFLRQNSLGSSASIAYGFAAYAF